LPGTIECQQTADLKEAGGNIDGFGEMTPLLQVTVDFPVGIAVIDDEEI
jgi:hypothetical protein